MGVLALNKPTSFVAWLKRTLGSFTVGQNKFADGAVLENAGDPTGAVPIDFLGQMCVDITNSHTYVAQGAAVATAAWARIDN